jgi:hypothetical protein
VTADVSQRIVCTRRTRRLNGDCSRHIKPTLSPLFSSHRCQHQTRSDKASNNNKKAECPPIFFLFSSNFLFMFVDCIDSAALTFLRYRSTTCPVDQVAIIGWQKNVNGRAARTISPLKSFCWSEDRISFVRAFHFKVLSLLLMIVTWHGRGLVTILSCGHCALWWRVMVSPPTENLLTCRPGSYINSR